MPISIQFETFALVFISAAALSLALTFFFRRVALRLEIVDKPNQPHKLHSAPIPYLGGLGVFFSFALFAFAAPLFFKVGPDYFSILQLVFWPGLVVCSVGLWDDLRALSARTRLLIQVTISSICSLMLSTGGLAAEIFSNPLLNHLITVLWLVGITNAMNFIDNLDGSAARVTSISSFGIFILSIVSGQFLLSYFAIVLAASSLGFLYWNRNPARIYLGDSGSLFIGLVLSVLLLQYQPTDIPTPVSLTLPILIMALPIMDATVAVIGRVQQRRSIFTAGRDHISHRIQARGCSKTKTVNKLSALSAIFVIVAIVIVFSPDIIKPPLAFISIMAMGIITLYFLRIDLS